MKKCVNDNILMYLNYNESKSIIAARFNRTLKRKTCKKMIVNIRNLYLDRLVHEYNNSYHGSIGKKLADAGYCFACRN